MVRKKGKRKHITSTQIFIILLFVLIVAFGAIYLFSGTGDNVVGQAAGDTVPYLNFAGREVYLQGGAFGNYLCITDSNYLNACSNKEDIQGTHWVLESAGEKKFYLKHVKTGKYLLAQSGEHKWSGSGNYINIFIYVTSGKENLGNKWVFDQSKGPNYGLKSESGQYLLIRDSHAPIYVELHTKFYLTKPNDYSSVFKVLDAVDVIKQDAICAKKGEIQQDAQGESFACVNNNKDGNTDDVLQWQSLKDFGDLLLGDLEKDITAAYIKASTCTSNGISEDKTDLCYLKKIVPCDVWRGPENYDGKYFCPGSSQPVWLECNKVNSGTTNKNGEKYCDGTKWLDCTKKLDGTYKGTKQCVSGFWVTDASIADDKLFEVTLDKTKRKINNVNYDLCDINTGSLSDRATICKADVPVTPTIYSLQALKAKPDLMPVVYDIGQNTKVLLNYVAPTDKTKIVSAILHKEIESEVSASFSLGSFSSNLAAGQRLALQLKGQPEIYLLSHPKDQLFSFENLQLEELKGSSIITKETKGNFYQFKFPGGFITIEDKGSTVEITSVQAGEAIVSSAKTNILSEVYEISFDFNNPVKLKDFDEDVISVCSNDQSKDPNALRVCLNNKELSEGLLDEGILTKIKMTHGELAMLYRYENNKKTGYLFNFKKIDESGLLVDYNYFPEAMAAGRRLALEFSGHLYLLTHPVKDVIAMEEASIFTFTKDKNPPDKLLGDNFRAEALVADGKIVIERDPEKKELPYTIKGLTKAQLAETVTDLSSEFQAQMSSKIPIKISNENLGSIAVDSGNDVTGDLQNFKIFASGTSKTFLLKDKVPFSTGNVLFYYVATQGDIKKADLYYLHDLDKIPSAQQNYDDGFIKTFTSGKKIGLLYKGQYYLLGFKGASNSFVISDVVLTTIGGSPVAGNAVGSKIDFSVPDGILSVWIENKPTGKDIIWFTAEDLSTKIFQKEQYSTLLTPASDIKIGNMVYSLNDEGVTQGQEGGVFLEISGAKPVLLNKDVLWLDQYKTNVFWYQGTKNGVKTVSVQPVVVIPPEGKTLDDWSNILDKVKDAKSKALYWQGEYFDFVGDKSLSSFSLRSIPEGNTYPIQHVQEGKNFLSNGTFVFKEHLLFAEQKPLTSDITKASLELTPVTHQLLTVDGLNTSIYSPPLIFVTSVGGPLYSMSYTKVNNNLFVTGSLVSPAKVFLKMSLPEGKSTKILFPDQTTGTIEVLNVTSPKPLFKITK